MPAKPVRSLFTASPLSSATPSILPKCCVLAHMIVGKPRLDYCLDYKEEKSRPKSAIERRERVNTFNFSATTTRTSKLVVERLIPVVYFTLMTEHSKYNYGSTGAAFKTE